MTSDPSFDRKYFNWGLAATLVAYAALLAPSLTSRWVNWRESDVLMVGRNLCRGDGTLWMPRVNQAGDSLGITGMEFPLLNRLGSLVVCGGAAQTFASRLVTLAFALMGIVALALLARRHLRGGGLWVAVVGFAFSPIVFFYGRVVQPDVPSVALGLLAVLLLDAAVESERTRWPLYFASAVAMALGALVKLPAIVYGLPMVGILWGRRGLGAAKDWRYWLYVPLALVPPAAWYAHARALQDAYGIHYFYLGTTREALLRSWVDPTFYQRIFLQRMFDSYAFPLVSAVGILFLAWRWRKMPGWIPLMAVSAVAFFFLGGESAAWHTCYGLVAVAPLALAAGWGVQELLGRVRQESARHAVVAALLLGIVGYGLLRTRAWRAPSESWVSYENARRALDSRLPADQRILVVSDGDPKALWYLDRKGWVPGPAWFAESAQPRPAAVAIDRVRVNARVQEARQRLGQSGYRPMFEDALVEIWVREGA